MATKYLDENGLLYFWQKIKNLFVTDVTYNSTSKKIQKTKAGTTSDLVTLSTVATSGSYNDLSNRPTIPSGVEKSTTTPKMDGTAAIGSETRFAAGDHIHPTDTSRQADLGVTDLNLVTTDVTGIKFLRVGGLEVGGTNLLTGEGLDTVNSIVAQTYVPNTAKGAASGVCPLDANSKVDAQYLPSYVDDVIEAYARSGATALSASWLSTTSGGSALTPETGKIYVLMADSTTYSANTQFRWSGSAYVKLADGGVSAITNAEIDTIVAA